MAIVDTGPPQQTAGDAHSNKNIAPLVRLPNGDPAVGAEVVLYWDTAQARWDAKQFKLVFDRVSPSRRSATDKAGRVQLATPSDDFWLAIAHPSGFLRRRFGPNTVPTVIELAPWARIEGTFRVGRKVQPNAEVSIELLNHNQHGPHEPWFGATQTVKTDAAGQFVFAHVAPGRTRISKRVRFGIKHDLPNSSAVYAIEVQAGKTMKIDLGASGRPVIGQLRVPPNSAVKLGADSVNIIVDSDDPQPEEPRQFLATVDDEGNFCIDDVPVGDYRISVFIRAAARIVRFDQFTVPAINEKLSQRPVDLGILPFNPRLWH